VNKGTIEDIHIYGDFFGLGEVADLEKALIGYGRGLQEHD